MSFLLGQDILGKTSEKVKWARLSVLSNTALMLLKIGAGLLILSISVISEAVHSGIDLIAAIITTISVARASAPPDKEHRFGHGKVENISGVVEAILIIIAAVLIIYESCLRILQGVLILDVNLGVAVMFVSVVVNYGVSRKLFSIAKKHDSIALKVDAYHLKTDIYTSFGVLVGLAIILVGNRLGITGINYLDPIIAIFVAIVIIKAGYDLTKESMKGLMDMALPGHEERIIRGTIEKHSMHYTEFHAFRSRKSGSERHIDLHLVVSKHTNLEKAHALCDHLEREINTVLSRVHVLIHLEPCDSRCRMCRIWKKWCSGTGEEKRRKAKVLERVPSG